MMLFVGDTRARGLLAEIAEPYKASHLALGQLVQRGRLVPWIRAAMRGERHWRWAYDNGAYADYKAGQRFNEREFIDDIELMRQPSPLAALFRRDA